MMLLRISTLIFVSFFITPSVFAIGAPNPHKTVYYAEYPEVNYNSGAGTKEQIKHGEYLSKAGDCIACHTDSSKPKSLPFAGGTFVYTPFGEFYGPNITGDEEYGIGSWTEEQFIRTMQLGIRPDGSYAYPVFPFVHFNQVSREDLRDIHAYLLSIPKINEPSPKNNIMWPFGWRFLQLGWRIMFFEFNKPGEYKNDPSQSAEWNRGKYLVDGLGHCGMCHTPLNPLGAEKNKYYLTGGNFIEGYFAPDITADGLKGASVEQIVNVFKTNQSLKGGKVGGPMLEVNMDSLRYLSDSDLHAIAGYLLSVHSDHPPAGDTTVTPQTGHKIYKKVCAQCHDNGGAGAPMIADTVIWQNLLTKNGLASIHKNAIGGIGSMPVKGGCATCTDDQIKATVDYMIKVSQESIGKTGPKATQGFPEKLSLQEGKQIYQNSCASCHASGKDGAPKTGDKQAWQPLIAKNMDILFLHTLQGYGTMPAKGGCDKCTTLEIQAAVKYMVEESKAGGDFTLW